MWLTVFLYGLAYRRKGLLDLKIAVVGSGAMGMGIAQAFAQADGYEVKLCVASGRGFEEKQIKFARPLQKLLKRGRITEERYREVLGRVDITDISGAAECELVIESVVEDFDVKAEVFEKLDKICGDSAILATNTSSLSITGLSSKLSRPIVGMHFFNPAAVMKLVEVIPGLTTTSDMVEKVKRIAADIGKVPVEVKEGPGFAVNRLLIPMINEAVLIVEEGLTDVEGIDEAMRLGANHPMGPLTLADMIGLDVCCAIMEVLFQETLDSKYRPARLLRKMVRAKYLGKKTGRGFYQYDESGRMIPGSAVVL